MIQTSGKVWGLTKAIFERNNVEIHHLAIKKGGHCSLHKHDHKYNLFYIIDGKLTIEVRKSDYPLTDKTVLEAGEMCVVKPGEFHRFLAEEGDVECMEMYWVELDPEDIHRESVGGMG